MEGLLSTGPTPYSFIVGATVENHWGSLEKLSLQEGPLGAHTVLWGNVMALDTLLRGQFFHTSPLIFHSPFQPVKPFTEKFRL